MTKSSPWLVWSPAENTSNVEQVNVAYTCCLLRGTLSCERHVLRFWHTLKNLRVDKSIHGHSLRCHWWSCLPSDVSPQSISQTPFGWPLPSVQTRNGFHLSYCEVRFQADRRKTMFCLFWQRACHTVWGHDTISPLLKLPSRFVPEMFQVTTTNHLSRLSLTQGYRQEASLHKNARTFLIPHLLVTLCVAKYLCTPFSIHLLSSELVLFKVSKWCAVRVPFRWDNEIEAILKTRKLKRSVRKQHSLPYWSTRPLHCLQDRRREHRRQGEQVSASALLSVFAGVQVCPQSQRTSLA